MIHVKFFKTLRYKRIQSWSIDQLIMKKTVISFFFFFLFFGVAIEAWKWLHHQPPNAQGKTNAPLRNILNANEKIFNGLLIRQTSCERISWYLHAARKARVNGNSDCETPFDPITWAMNVIRKKGDTIKIKLDDIRNCRRQRSFSILNASKAGARSLIGAA